MSVSSLVSHQSMLLKSIFIKQDTCRAIAASLARRFSDIFTVDAIPIYDQYHTESRVLLTGDHHTMRHYPNHALITCVRLGPSKFPSFGPDLAVTSSKTALIWPLMCAPNIPVTCAVLW